MNQIQVNIVQLQFLEACIDGFGYVGYVGDHFRRYEELRSINFAFFNRNSHFRLCVIYFGIVKVIVAKLNGCLYPFDGLSVDAAFGGLVPSSPGWQTLERWTGAAVAWMTYCHRQA